MNTSKPTRLFNGRTTAGQSEAVPSYGSYLTLIASGTWGGASLVVQVSPDEGATWVDSEVSLTANGVKNFIAGSGLRYRLDLRNVTAASVSAWVAFEA